ncbi:sensor histidine kinase [Ralstonia solanacearum]|nr:sensor histidine kinase [Ralstonia solanacearum]
MGRRFFLESGCQEAELIIKLAYDLAWFWHTDPEVMLRRPVSRLLTYIEHANRINRERTPEP